MNYTEFVAKVLAISRVGLKFSKDEYALENYQELQELAQAQLKDEHGFTPIDIPYQPDLYPTPSISVRVIVFNDQGQLLMGQKNRMADTPFPVGGVIFLKVPRKPPSKKCFKKPDSMLK